MTTDNNTKKHNPIGNKNSNEEDTEFVVSSTQAFVKAKALSEKKYQKQRYIGILLSSCIIAMCIIAVLIDSFVVRYSINKKLEFLQEQAISTNSKLDNITKLLLRPLSDLSFVISTEANAKDVETIDTWTKKEKEYLDKGNKVFKYKKDSLMFEMISINKQVDVAFDSLTQIQKEKDKESPKIKEFNFDKKTR